MKRFTPLLLAVSVVGCQPAEEPMHDPKIAKVEMKGSVNKDLVGFWSTSDKRSSLDLKSDGTSRIKATVFTRAGESKVDVAGRWATDQQTLYIENEQTSGKVVEKYSWKRPNAKTLELSRTFPKTVTRYTLQSKA